MPCTVAKSILRQMWVRKAYIFDASKPSSCPTMRMMQMCAMVTHQGVNPIDAQPDFCEKCIIQ
jgi:hypothetical protein